MTTTEENHEVADPMQAKSEKIDAATGPLETDTDEQPVGSAPADTEPLDSEQADAETPNNETLKLKQAEIEPGIEDVLDSEQAETVLDSEQAENVLDSEQAETEPVSEDLLDFEQAETQPESEVVLDTEPCESNGLSEGVEAQPVGEVPPGSEQAVSNEAVGSDQAETKKGSSEEALGSDLAEEHLVSNEVVGSEQAETKGLIGEAVGSEDPEAHPVSNEVLGPEQAELETVSEEPTDMKQADVEPTSTELLAPEQADTNIVSDDPMDTEQTDTDTRHEEPVSSELTEQQPSSVEMVNSHHDGLEEQSVAYEESNHPGPVSSEMTNLQPDDSEHAALHPVDANTQPDANEATVTAENEQVINGKPSNIETVGVEQDSLEQVNEEGEPMSMDIPDQQPPVSELDYSHSDVQELAVSQPMNSELVHMQPDGSEFVGSHQVHTDFVNSQSFDHETHPAMYNMETIHENDEFVKMEHVHPEGVHTEAVNSDIDQLQMSQELMHELHVTSELAHQLHVGSDLAHMQPVSSEIIHSQQMNPDLVHSEPYVSEFDNSPTVGSDMANMQIVATDMVNSEFPDPETQPSKRRKKKSVVWEHFTIETVGAGCRRACCKVCKQSFAYSTGSKVAGTSHLKRHIAKGTCPLLLRQQDKNQLTPYVPKSAGAETGTPGTTDTPKRRYRTSNSPYLIFDQERCRHEIARMVIMHEYPLHMIEHSGFVSFVQNLQPRFDMVNFNTVQGDCVATYLREKQNLQKLIDGMPGRICLSVDMWSSTQTTGYAFLHCQFIDSEYKLHRRLLNIVMDPFPESDTALSHAVATCLSYWNLDNKLCSITFNQSVSDAGRDNMRGLLSIRNPSILNGQLLLGSCLARTLTSMAQDVLAAGQDVVRKIRSSVKYVKTSHVHEDKFLELKQQLQVPSEKTLILDSTTRWNTTYDMLAAACELKEVFSCLDTFDPECKDAPTMEDWTQAEYICMYLRLLYETTNFLVEKIPPCTNIFFHEVWKIQLELTRNAASEDHFVSTVASILQEKFLKYWRDSFLVLAIAVAMDPRFKMKLVEFSFAKLFGEEAPAYTRMADEGIHGLFHEYMTLNPADSEGRNNGNLDAEVNHPASNGLSDFDMYIMESNSQQMKSELDQYLDESLLPRMQEFDVIGWWKMNRLKYPTLSKMARDILSIPLSSVGPNYVYDTVIREMDQYRTSLRPETMEALICAKDWLSV